MYLLTQNFPLKDRNTFGIEASARYFLSLNSPDEFTGFLADNHELFNSEKRLIIGGGSNLLFIRDYDGLVISPGFSGCRVIDEDSQFVFAEAGAGVEWDDFVAWTVSNGWGGVENLSLIPGKVGASPVQNIGAYGVEVESAVWSVNGIDLDDFQQKTYSRSECDFAYRNSLFKRTLLNRYMVTSVVFKLKKKPEFVLEYGALKSEVEKLGAVTLKNIREAVISIRESKLPDPARCGNAGSFFKNPMVDATIAEKIKDQYPQVPLYPGDNGLVKVAAGWLIEKSGWKGRSVGNAAVHDKQALVIVNKGNATGKEIYDLSEIICLEVEAKFGIRLEREVNVIG